MYKNAYELAQKRKEKNDFASALAELKTDDALGVNKQNSAVDGFNTGYSQAGGKGNGLSSLGTTFGKYLAGLGEYSSSSNSVPSQYQFANMGKSLFGGYDLGGTNAGKGSLFGNTATASNTGSSFLGKVAPYSGLIAGGINAGTEAINGGSWSEDVPQAFFSIDSKNDSDVMQALKGAGQGAMMGAPFGPIGAVVGGVLGLGSSFLDDI